VEVTSFLHLGTDRAEQFHVLAYFPARFASPPLLRQTALHRRGERVQARWQKFVMDWMDRLGEDDRDKERTLAVLGRASGVEVYTSRHKPEIAEQFRAFAEENKKCWTASSDDHQNARYMRPPAGAPVATFERILGRALPIGAIFAA
jgi:hypothetical protein